MQLSNDLSLKTNLKRKRTALQLRCLKNIKLMLTILTMPRFQFAAVSVEYLGVRVVNIACFCDPKCF